MTSLRNVRIAILTPEASHNACARVRLLDVLQRLAPEVSYCWITVADSQSDADSIRRDVARSDVVVIQRAYAHPGTVDFLAWVLFDSGKPVLFEIDDLLTDLPEEHPEYARYERLRPLMLACMANCDAMLVSTPGLRDSFAPYNPCIHVHPNALDEARWHTPYSPRLRRSDRPVTIGFAGTASHGKDLACIEGAVERIQARFGERVRFVFHGCVTPHLLDLPGSIHVREFIPYDVYPARLRGLELDIGLAPLQDGWFNACKSNLKYLEYAACGIPGIYSDTPSYRESVRHSETGLLVPNTTEAWCDAMAWLVDDAAAAESIAAAAHNDVWQSFSIAQGAPAWRAMVEGILDGIEPARRPGRTLVRAMWDMVVEYENRASEQEARLSALQGQLHWLENRPWFRLLRTVKRAMRGEQAR